MQVGDFVLPILSLRKFAYDGDIDRDCIERVAQVIDIDDAAITLKYVGHVLTNGGELVKSTTIPLWMADKCRVVEFVDLGYGVGPMGGQLIPLEVMMDRNWKNQHIRARARGQIHRRAWLIAVDIRTNGLRHLPVVDETLKLMYGAARTWAHMILKREYVECYVIKRL